MVACMRKVAIALIAEYKPKYPSLIHGKIFHGKQLNCIHTGVNCWGLNCGTSTVDQPTIQPIHRVKSVLRTITVFEIWPHFDQLWLISEKFSNRFAANRCMCSFQRPALIRLTIADNGKITHVRSITINKGNGVYRVTQSYLSVLNSTHIYESKSVPLRHPGNT